ncbi:MAG: zinc metallopeptidase [Firmicutes bacterium]|nr:zinc metallopeptidase [Bacillota bacterium]
MDLSIFLCLLIVPVMALVMIIKNYNKCKNIINENNLCGVEIAHRILEKNKLDNIYVVEILNSLNDHYDSKRKVIRLSKEIFNENSMTSLVISAQQCAYAIQDKNNYSLFKIRCLLEKIIKAFIILSYILFLLGLFANMTDAINLGIALISICLIYELLMLPVEFKANKIALSELKKLKIIEKSEEEIVSRLLRTMSFKYVASIITSLVDLIKYIMSLIVEN